jgi:arabinan endo-1,5-alpha-L-arabinosidase
MAYTGGSNNLWAPDIPYRHGHYSLHYSALDFGLSKSAIFLATSSTGVSGSWAYQGLVTESTTSSNWNVIDLNLTVDAQGKW